MKKEVKQFKEMQYVVRYPKNYHPEERYPLLLLLHGAGSRGNDVDLLLNNPFFRITDNMSLPFVTVAPQCSENTWFDLFQVLEGFVKEIAANRCVNHEKIYVIGASMGGYAAWQLAMSMPEYFAAIVPICGGGMYWNADRLVNVPIWAFHGEKDSAVLVEESVKMVNAVNQAGGNARLTVYPNTGHDAWSDTYCNPEVFEWLLAHKNKNMTCINEKYTDSNLYG